MENQSVFEILRAEVHRANEDYVSAKAQFWKIASQNPGGTPQSDGPRQIQNAAAAQTRAMISYTNALRRFNEFLLNGTIPEDLLKANPSPVDGSSKKGPVSDNTSPEKFHQAGGN